jgi:hypothetical protein
VIYNIANVKMTPPSTRTSPWGFQSLGEARTFAVISYRPIWAVCAFDPNLYHVFPGGRCESYPPEIRDKWAAEKVPA